MKVRIASLSVALAALLVLPASIPAQTIFDDFSDSNDTANPAWVHLSGLLLSTGQSWDASGGNYRLQAPNNSALLPGYGFVGSYVPSSYADSITRADFVSFGGPGLNAVFMVGARLNGNDTPNELTGYALAYEPYAASLAGELVLYRITGAAVTDISALPLSLDPAKDYTFELTTEGSLLTGRVYEVGGGLVALEQGVDATYASGYSGLLGYSGGGTAPTDFTADNFSVNLVPEPTTGALLGSALLALVARRRFRGSRL